MTSADPRFAARALKEQRRDPWVLSPFKTSKRPDHRLELMQICRGQQADSALGRSSPISDFGSGNGSRRLTPARPARAFRIMNSCIVAPRRAFAGAQPMAILPENSFRDRRSGA